MTGVVNIKEFREETESTGEVSDRRHTLEYLSSSSQWVQFVRERDNANDQEKPFYSELLGLIRRFSDYKGAEEEAEECRRLREAHQETAEYGGNEECRIHFCLHPRV